MGIYVKYGEPSVKLLTSLGANRYFGETGLVEARPRTATAVALEPCTLSMVSAEGFKGYMTQRPNKVLEIISNLSLRLRELTGDYTDACRTIAVIEAGSAKEKDGWLKTQVKKLSAAYNEGMSIYYNAANINALNSQSFGAGTYFYPLPF